jgi:hypothetical protein
LNPGPPAPQAGVIIRTRRQAPETRLYDKAKLLNVLAKLKVSGLGEGTLRTLNINLENYAKRQTSTILNKLKIILQIERTKTGILEQIAAKTI